MSYDLSAFTTANIRGSDVNSLMRLHDLANEIFKTSRLQQERVKMDKAIQRINKELEKRNLPASSERVPPG